MTETNTVRNLTGQLTSFQTWCCLLIGNMMFAMDCDMWHGSQTTPLLQGCFPEKGGEAQTKEFWQNRENVYCFVLPVKRSHRPNLYLSMVSYPKKQERRNCMINRTFFHWLNSVAWRKRMIRLIMLQFTSTGFTKLCILFSTWTKFPKRKKYIYFLNPRQYLLCEIGQTTLLP